MIPGKRCDECEKVTIKGLLDLATSRLGQLPGEVRLEILYKLHESIANLEHAANEGCDFCGLVIYCLRGYAANREDDYHASLWGYRFPANWKGDKCKLEESLLIAAKKLESSVVRIGLTLDRADLVGGSPMDLEDLAEKEALHYLFVHIGSLGMREGKDKSYESVSIYDSASDSSRPSKIPTLCLNIATPRRKPATIGRLRVGAYHLSTDLDSDDAFNVARDWIETCDYTHTDCISHLTHRLPTRVIDVGMSETWKDARLIHSHGARRPYLTLSHCWGGPIEPKLTEETIESFQVRLPFLELPANFQDAIRITRKLGYRYLWIDALCIVQGSELDSAEELKGMGDVYRNSTLNISAMVSPKSSCGILRPRSNIHSAYHRTVYVRVEPGGDASVTLERGDETDETLSRIYDDCALSRRGWCLQESILSPRQLYYGARQLYWRCPNGFRAADGTASSSMQKFDLLPHVSSYLHQGVVRDSEASQPHWNRILSEYYELVQMYCNRNLAFEDDMLPAFSGISSRLSPLLGDYLAGLWEKDFRQGLLWEPQFMIPPQGGRIRHSITYRAPSWSWAAVQGDIWYWMLPDVPASRSAELIKKRIVLQDETNPFGRVLHASITLRGLTKPVRRRRTRRPSESPEDAGWTYNYSNSDSDESEIRFKCLDPIVAEYTLMLPITGVDGTDRACEEKFQPESHINPDATEEYLALLIWVADDDGTSDHISNHRISGLILKRARTSLLERYVRIGAFRPDSRQAPRLDSWERKIVELV